MTYTRQSQGSLATNMHRRHTAAGSICSRKSTSFAVPLAARVLFGTQHPPHPGPLTQNHSTLPLLPLFAACWCHGHSSRCQRHGGRRAGGSSSCSSWCVPLRAQAVCRLSGAGLQAASHGGGISLLSRRAAVGLGRCGAPVGLRLEVSSRGGKKGPMWGRRAIGNQHTVQADRSSGVEDLRTWGIKSSVVEVSVTRCCQTGALLTRLLDCAVR